MEIKQGWQCPVCKHVYNPIIPKCQYCGNVDAVATEDTAKPYIHPHDIVFKENPLDKFPNIIRNLNKKFS